jgi:Fur family transcriptional regulator, iron response regulator
MSPEALYEEALQLETSVSLATVYNTLRQFTCAGFLKEIPIEGSAHVL